MSKERTSIIPHVADIVQNVITKTLKKKIDAYSKNVKEFETEVCAVVFPEEPQRLYNEREDLRPYLWKTAWGLQWRYTPKMFTPKMTTELSELFRAMGGGSAFEPRDNSSYFIYLPSTFDRARTENRQFWEGSRSHSNIRGGTRFNGSCMRPSAGNTWSRVGPVGHSHLYLGTETMKDEATHVVVPAAMHRRAGELFLESVRIHAKAIALSSELWDAFRQRGTIERFREDFPELEKCIPYIPSKVKALVTPSLGVVKALKKEGLDVPVE